MKTMLVHQAAMGDWVLTLPMLRALQGERLAVSHWSKAQLAARLVPGVKPVDIELREFTRLHMQGGPAVLSPQVAEYFESLDQIISFVSERGDVWAENVEKIAPHATLACLSTRPPADFDGHTTDWHRRQADDQGIALPNEAHVAEPRSNPDGPVLIHPGSGSAEKCWPLERFEAVARWLEKRGREVRVLLGEVELERLPKARVDHLQKAFGPTPAATLDELADAIENASCYIGNDSGPSHLAGAMGLPTIAIFGPTSPTHWRPLGPAVTVIAPDGPCPIDWLTADELIEKIEPIVFA